MQKNKVKSRIVAILCAIAVLIAAFFVGFAVGKGALPEEVSTYKWALQMIDENYCGDYNDSGYVYVPDNGYSRDEIALKALAGTLDIYSAYYTAEEYAATVSDNSGNKSGIGISTNFDTKRGVTVISVMGNSPAFKAGLRPGDRLTGGSAGGERVEFTANKLYTDFIGARKTGEEFTLYTDDNSFTLAKSEYIASYATMYTANMEYGFTDGNGGLKLYQKLSDRMSYLPEYAAYIGISQFFGSLGGEFAYLVEAFNSDPKTDTLIIDLRNNGGGYVNSMQAVAGCFSQASGKEAMRAVYKNGKKDIYKAAALDARFRLNAETTVYVLCNLNTASASEALIGVLVSYGILDYNNIFISQLSADYMNWAGRPEDTGTAKSYGKGIMQSTFVRRSTGEALKLTTAKIYWPNGKCIHGTGLNAQTDGCRALPAEWTATKGDTELQAAVRQIEEDRKAA